MPEHPEFHGTMAPWADTQEDADPSDAQRTSSELRKDAEADQTDVGNVEFLGRHQIRIQYVFEVASLEKKIIRFGLGRVVEFIPHSVTYNDR